MIRIQTQFTIPKTGSSIWVTYLGLIYEDPNMHRVVVKNGDDFYYADIYETDPKLPGSDYTISQEYLETAEKLWNILNNEDEER